MPTRTPRAAGQIVIPAMLIFPTLFLFVYLIYETAKLSREKIRHQFAMDAAAFVEMANYSDFLNRTAYINGAFPMRIFEEGYADDFQAECEGKTTNCNQRPYREILYENGAFPRSQSGKHDYSNEPSWDIAYGGAGSGKNDSPPQLTEPFMLLTLQNANDYYQQYDLATEIYKFYVQIYSLLGSVEDAQFKVLQRLSGDHSFLKKSYWLNTGDPIDSANQLAASFNTAIGDFDTSVKPVCLHKLKYCGNQYTGGTGLQVMRAVCSTPDDGIVLPTSQGCSTEGGLFQMEWVPKSEIDKFRTAAAGGYPGLSLSMNWAVPEKNYWNVNFPALLSQRFPNGDLHTTISLLGDPSTQPSVWPNPTPKFQVRQFP
jgi:hypothetical protein